jgi:hypothetical protein
MLAGIGSRLIKSCSVNVTWTSSGTLSRTRAFLLRRVLFALKINWEGWTSLVFGGLPTGLIVKRQARYSAVKTFKYRHPRENLVQVHSFDERYVYEVNEVFLDTKNGLLFSSDRKVIAESTPWPIHYILMSAVPKPPRFRVKKILDDGSPLICLTGNGFYHWLIEDLPPFLFLLQNLNQPKVVLWEKAPKHVELFLNELNIEIIRAPQFVSIEKFNFISFGNDTSWPHPQDIKSLQDSFRIKCLPKPEKKIYVSRVNSSRSPIFEASLVDALKNSGWITMELQEFSLMNQIEMFSDASVIAGIHGAGLSAMVWMPDNSLIIELTPIDFNPIFSRMAEVCNHRYSLITFNENVDSNCILGKIVSQAS